MKLLKRCPLTVMLAVSAVLLTAVAWANRGGIYREYDRNGNAVPALSLLLEAAKDGVYPWSAGAEDVQMVMADVPAEEGDGPLTADGAAGAEQGGSDGFGESGGPVTGETGDAPEGPPDGGTEEAPEGEAETSEEAAGEAEGGGEDRRSAETAEGAEAPEGTEAEGSEPLTAEEDVTYDYVQVDESYLDDALFIGDSRTQGLFEYGGLEDHATFYCKTSLTIYDLFKNDSAFIRTESGNLTLTQALSQKQFGKIYLMLGINEMGTGTAESFFTEYAKAVLKIRELQPDAILFVEGIMHVAAKKNASDPIFNNFNIDVRNVEIQTLENRRDIFYLDVNEVVCDEAGNLFDGWSFDQIHLKGKYYQVWRDFLLQHGILRAQDGKQPGQF